MKMWFASSPANQEHVSNDDCDEDCAECTGWAYRNPILPLLAADIERVRRGSLQMASSLYIQAYDDEHWLVCNPTETGHIAVLDRQALTFLQQFHYSTMLSHMPYSAYDGPLEDWEKGVALLYKSGFLQDTTDPSLPSPQQGREKLTAWLHVTNECNLRCSYCYLQKTHEDMPDDVGRKAVDALFRSAIKHSIQGIKLKYAGGEASLHMRNIISLHDYAAQLAQEHTIKLEAVLLSNGVALSQRAIENLKARQIAITISIDGLGVYHDTQRPFANGSGSSKYVLRTIDRLLANDVIPHITITVSRRNLAGLPELMHYVLAQNLPFSLNYYRENECSAHIADLRFQDEQIIGAMHSAFSIIEQNMPRRSLLNSLLDKARMNAPHQRTCGVGQNYLVIDQRGGIAKCQMDMQHTVATVEAADPLEAIRTDRLAVQGLPVEEKEGCRSCQWRNWCTGGCPLLTYQVTGRYDVKSPNCHIYKALFPAVLRLEALRLLRHEVPIDLNTSVDQSALVCI